MDFERFLLAQDGTYADATHELAAGRKESHWMWFIFPQVAGLGNSSTTIYYAINSLADAKSYAAHPILGARLRECTSLLLAATGSTAVEIMGRIDAMKLHSSMTLFHAAVPEELEFGEVLDRFYAGVQDAATLRILADWGPDPDSVGP